MGEVELFINTDGGSRNNPGDAAIGVVIKDSAGKVLELCGKYIGVQTNNVAEYTAVIEALKIVQNKWGGGLKVNFFLDSQLVVNQLGGSFQIKNQTLNLLARQVKELERGVGQVTYQYIPRTQNTEADSLVNKALDERTA